MTRGRRKNLRLERRRRNRISRSLILAYATGRKRREIAEAQIERLKKVNVGRAPWNCREGWNLFS